jgi:hypothetical protein
VIRIVTNISHGKAIVSALMPGGQLLCRSVRPLHDREWLVNLTARFCRDRGWDVEVVS